MRKSFLLLTIVATIGCRQKDKSNEHRQLLQGDWASGLTIEGSLYGPRVIFSFEDSLMAAGAHGTYIKYTDRGDSLLTEKVDFRIFSLTQDSLIIGTYFEDQRRNDSFRLARVRAKNSLVPVKIFYSSSGCFGSCPSMHLEIDSSGKFLFWGREYTTNKGAHSGQLSSQQYQQVLDRVRQIPLDSLKKRYEANWTDDQSESVVILTTEKRIGTSVYGFDKEPVELRILFHKLSELYKTIPLRADTTLTMEYFFRYNTSQIHPPPKIEPPR